MWSTECIILTCDTLLSQIGKRSTSSFNCRHRRARTAPLRHGCDFQPRVQRCAGPEHFSPAQRASDGVDSYTKAVEASLPPECAIGRSRRSQLGSAGAQVMDDTPSVAPACAAGREMGRSGTGAPEPDGGGAGEDADGTGFSAPWRADSRRYREGPQGSSKVAQHRSVGTPEPHRERRHRTRIGQRRLAFGAAVSEGERLNRPAGRRPASNPIPHGPAHRTGPHCCAPRHSLHIMPQ